MRILCIGDSLGLPRDGCLYDDTWLHLLIKKYPQHEFIGQFSGGRLINNALVSYNNSFKYYNADIVILQLGIVDCAPRYINDTHLFPRISRKIFEKLGLSRLYWKIVKIHSRRPDCVYTKPVVFEEIYSRLVSSIIKDGGKVIIINIGHGDESVQKSSPYFNSNVDKYNKIINIVANKNAKHVIAINPLDVVENDMFVDGYHCAAKGMKKVYDNLCIVLDNIG